MNSDFHKAGSWFLCFALLPTLPWLFVLPGILLPTTLYFSGDTSIDIAAALLVIALPVGPLLSAYLLGGFLGKAIITDPSLSIWKARLRGALIAVGALLVFVTLNLVDINYYDYSNSTETSAERSLSIVSGISTFMAPLVILIGAWAGAKLKTHSTNRINSV